MLNGVEKVAARTAGGMVLPTFWYRHSVFKRVMRGSCAPQPSRRPRGAA